MIFNSHSRLEGSHAFLSASNYHWVNYTDEKLIQSYGNYRADQKGTVLHAFAKQCIVLGQKLPRTKQTLNMYVNDAIGFRMTPEQVLFYSENCFGTADAISFYHNTLRIHDYKSGTSRVSMTQLQVYTALFCLEYGIRPGEIDIVLRIYQSDAILEEIPELERIVYIMDKIVTFDKAIDRLKKVD